MGQLIAFSLVRKRVNLIRSLSYTPPFWRLLFYSAVGFLAWIAALILFPVFLANASPVLYIPHQDSHTLSVMDGNTYSMIRTITVAARWGGIAVSPDGKTVFVTTSDTSSLAAINTETNTVQNTVYIGNRPYGVGVSPGGNFAYVSVQSTGGGNGTVSVIDTNTYRIVSTINVGKGPQGVAFHPDGSRAYITNYSDASVSVIDTASRHVIKTIKVGGGPSGIAVHPLGSYVYTVNQFDHTLSVISTASYSDIKTVGIGQYPSGVAIDPLGKFIYTVNWGEGSVSVVDVSSNSVVKTISVGSGPSDISLESSGSRAYVVNINDNTISVIDTASQAVIVTASAGTNPNAFGRFVAEPMIPSPTGANSFALYTDAVIPLLDSDPGKSKPIGMGTIAGVGSLLNLSLGANKFSNPMDVYLAISMPAIDPSGLFLFTSSGLNPLSAGLSPWKTSVTDISGVVVPDLDALILPTGTYVFYLHVVPASTSAADLFLNYYQWSASLSVVRASDVANKAIALFGTDLDAAVAIFLASDKGYSLDQIITAIDAGTLSSLGEIQGVDNTSSGLREGNWGGAVANKYCGDLDPKNALDQRFCKGRIAAMLEKLELEGDKAGIKALKVLMATDIGYNSAQIDLVDDKCCGIVTTTLQIQCCGQGVDYCTWTDCSIIEPADPPTNKLTEVLDAICPILGGNRNSRIISKNPFISFQAASLIPGLRLASPSDNCTPICTDSDGDGYYVQSGCGTGGTVDCNDGNSNINPGILESCADGVDNNCDGKIDTQDPGCNLWASCPDPDYPTLCGPMCHVSGAVCCDDTGQACAAGKDCCGTACMPAGNVCCAPLGHCSPGSTCDYENKTCISSGAVVTDILTHSTKRQLSLEGPNK